MEDTPCSIMKQTDNVARWARAPIRKKYFVHMSSREGARRRRFHTVHQSVFASSLCFASARLTAPAARERTRLLRPPLGRLGARGRRSGALGADHSGAPGVHLRHHLLVLRHQARHGAHRRHQRQHLPEQPQLGQPHHRRPPARGVLLPGLCQRLCRSVRLLPLQHNMHRAQEVGAHLAQAALVPRLRQLLAVGAQHGAVARRVAQHARRREARLQVAARLRRGRCAAALEGGGDVERGGGRAGAAALRQPGQRAPWLTRRHAGMVRGGREAAVGHAHP
mmetsp:Transcript_39950/g.102176  ORF Transcript_39950/g.102176 Transcript_39950/m.102176 type:complete len:279 (+) Transcript_39950:130-966(+)